MNTIIYDIFHFFRSYFLGATICAIVVGAGYFFYCNRRGRDEKHVLRGVVISLFAAYCYIVLGITLLSREQEVYRVIKLLPFSTFEWNPVAAKYIVENILLFVPLGIFANLLWQKRLTVKYFVWIAMISSMGIEFFQYITGRGRVETDDVILNTFGAVIGWYICKFFCNVVVNKITKKKR